VNRPIKFRAWDPDNKQMVKVRNLFFDHDNNITRVVACECPKPARILAERMVLMQFTGLHDKNGKEIWEGDILGMSGNNAQIIWDDARFVMKRTAAPYHDFPLCDGFSKLLEVIGNIHENGDLLK
jgi:hypothetical protein